MVRFTFAYIGAALVASLLLQSQDSGSVPDGELAVAAVREALARQPGAPPVRLELLRRPAAPPRVSTLSRQASLQGSQPVALIGAFQRDRVAGYYTVALTAGRTFTERSGSIIKLPPARIERSVELWRNEVQLNAPVRAVHMTQAERGTTVKRLESFFEALVDLAGDTGRLQPFLAADITCRVYYSGTRILTDVSDSQCALLTLETVSLAEWLSTVGKDNLPVRRAVFAPTGTVPNPDRVPAIQRMHASIRTELRSDRLIAADQRGVATTYLRTTLGEGQAVKVSAPERSAGGVTLDLPPAPARLYMIAGTPVALIFAEEGAALRLRCVFVGAG